MHLPSVVSLLLWWHDSKTFFLKCIFCIQADLHWQLAHSLSVVVSAGLVLTFMLNNTGANLLYLALRGSQSADVSKFLGVLAAIFTRTESSLAKINPPKTQPFILLNVGFVGICQGQTFKNSTPPVG